MVTALGHLPIDYARSDIALLLRDYGTKAAGMQGWKRKGLRGFLSCFYFYRNAYVYIFFSGDVWAAIRDNQLDHLLTLISETEQAKHQKRGRDIINEAVIWACVRKQWEILDWLLENEVIYFLNVFLIEF